MIEIERAILRNLNLCHPRLMATGTLWSEVRLDVDTSTYSAFTAALTALEQKGQVVVVPGEDRHKAKITDAGRARLME